jgi:hypothetical protein
MTMENIASILGWSILVNIGVFVVWLLAMKFVPGLAYKTQLLATTISREDFDRIMYRLMGQYKIALLVTHFGPYIALRIVMAG